MDLRDYLLVGSYLMGVGVWSFMWRAFRACESKIDRIEELLAEQRGLDRGHDHERRITQLERAAAPQRWR